MVIITEKQKVKNTSTFNIGVQNFDEDYLDSPEVLLNDWKLIQESEEMGGEMDVKEAYIKIKNYISNKK